MIQSPLNYTGGKYKLLPQILPLFPRDINVFVDLFCGGCNVGINVDCNRVIYNDLNENLLYLYNTFKNLDKESVLEWIYEIIEKYNLSLVSEHGYDYYGCESSKGLGNYNREGYLKLRADFNQKHANENFDYYYYVMLYVIIVYAFNNQIRFNSNGEFNLPVGKRDFNRNMQEKLSAFIDRIQSQNCKFTCEDFRNFEEKEEFLKKYDSSILVSNLLTRRIKKCLNMEKSTFFAKDLEALDEFMELVGYKSIAVDDVLEEVRKYQKIQNKKRYTISLLSRLFNEDGTVRFIKKYDEVDELFRYDVVDVVDEYNVTVDDDDLPF